MLQNQIVQKHETHTDKIPYLYPNKVLDLHFLLF